MSKSLFVKEYNKANIKNKDIRCFYQTINVSYLDVLNGNEVEVFVDDYLDCLCKSNDHKHDYFKECKKCNGNGKIVVNGHQLVCNECHGDKYIRVKDCYLCSNHSKILKETKKKIKLDSSLDSDSEIVLEYPDYKLVLRINIFDKGDYLIKDKDIYYLKSIKYSKEDYRSNKSKKIKTYKGYEYVSSKYKVKREVVKLVGKGIEDGDFYFIFDNEIENEKETVYANVLINNRGYTTIWDLVNLNFVVIKEEIALNEVNYVYINEDIDEVNNDEYIIRLNKLNKDDYIIENDELVYVLRLNREDNDLDKKSILINGEKININYKKNLKEVSYVTINNKGIYLKDGKRKDLKIKIIPYYENIYKIKIKNNKNVVYIEDYKHDDYSYVASFKKEDFLQDYIKVDKEDEVVINNDLVLIERV